MRLARRMTGNPAWIGGMLLVSCGVAHAKWEGPLPEPQVVLQRMQQKLGEAWVGSAAAASNAAPAACTELDRESRSLLGSMDPAGGRAATSLPGTPFWRWYQQCIERIARPRLLAPNADRVRALGSQLAQWSAQRNLAAVPWLEVPKSMRLPAARHLISHLLGAEVLAEFGRDPEAAAEEALERVERSLGAKASAADVLVGLVFVGMSMDEFFHE